MKILRYGIILLLSVTLWGCGKGNSATPITIDPSTGKHPAGTAVASTGGAHVDAYFASPSGCEGCHGKPGDLAGGIAKVSCSTINRSGMTCHAGKFPHGVGFGNPVLHGEKVRNAPIGANGIAFCKKCHGSNYQGVTGSGVSCIACHKLTNPANNAPHAGDWLNGTFKHSATNEANAPACGECHLGGKKLVTPVLLPAGTPAPTCFGATALCHFEAGHANPYIAKTDHGLAAHSNLGRCIPCHATFPVGSTVPNFSRVRGTTNLSPNGCQKCHTQAGLAHPYGWLPGRGTTVGQAGNNTTSHTTASFGATGEYCSPCHALTGITPLLNSVAPSCMTQTAQIGGTTFCHFTADPVANRSGCISCHGNAPNGPNGASFPNTANAHAKHTIISGITCNSCHNGAGSGTQLHANGSPNVSLLTSQVGATAAYTVLAKTCANISCHGGTGTTTPTWTATNVGCSACHGGPPTGPNGVSFPNTANAHARHVFPGVTCDACHSGAGSGKPLHTNGTPDVIILLSFQAETGGAAAYDLTTKTCANISCHGGTTTPAWTAVGINLTANCDNCHVLATNLLPAFPAPYAPSPVTPQYNSYWSGDDRPGNTSTFSLHASHLFLTGGVRDFFPGMVCADCHDTSPTAPLAGNHFSNLGTPAVEGPAAATIRPEIGYGANGPTCFTPIGYSGVASGVNCHFFNNPVRWK